MTKKIANSFNAHFSNVHKLTNSLKNKEKPLEGTSKRV
jgi:hypothetical protein